MPISTKGYQKFPQTLENMGITQPEFLGGLDTVMAVAGVPTPKENLPEVNLLRSRTTPTPPDVWPEANLKHWGEIYHKVDEGMKELGIPEVYKPYVFSTIWLESKGNPNTKDSQYGVRGLMQVTGGTAKKYGVVDPETLRDLNVNIRTGLQIIKDNIRDAGGNIRDMAALYNGGNTNLNKVPRPAETRGYIRKMGQTMKHFMYLAEPKEAQATPPPAMGPTSMAIPKGMSIELPAPLPGRAQVPAPLVETPSPIILEHLNRLRKLKGLA